MQYIGDEGARERVTAVRTRLNECATAESKQVCPLEANCDMYGLFRLDGMRGFWQALYCHGNHKRCERYRTAARGAPVPMQLLPDGKLLRSTRKSLLKL